jgi:hypothetical protein
MPARRIGYLILRSLVTGVWIVSSIAVVRNCSVTLIRACGETCLNSV